MYHEIDTASKELKEIDRYVNCLLETFNNADEMDEEKVICSLTELAGMQGQKAAKIKLLGRLLGEIEGLEELSSVFYKVSETEFKLTNMFHKAIPKKTKIVIGEYDA